MICRGDFDLRSTTRGRRRTNQVELATALTLEVLYAQIDDTVVEILTTQVSLGRIVGSAPASLG